MEKITTTDLADFGTREMEMATDLLNAKREQGLPEGFWDEDVRIMMNMHSGYVFFTNADYQAAMLNGDRLEIYHSCPSCGLEGFEEKLGDEGDNCCREYLGILIEDEEDEE